LSELAKRILFAVPAAIIFIGVLWIGGIWFELLIGIIAAITIWECWRMVGKDLSGAYFIISVIIALLIWFSFRLPIEAILIPALIIIAITGWFVIIKKYRNSSDRWMAALFTGIYAPLGFIMLVQIRNTGTSIEGFWLTLALMLMIWGNDVFAYFGGKNFGKTPLAPNVSPNKTWEGFWSGFIGALIGLTISWILADPFPLSYLMAVPAAIIASIFGPLGDLTESKIKRVAGVKDSSTILPGHGGMFDRFDAVILSAPFIFFYFYIVI